MPRKVSIRLTLDDECLQIPYGAQAYDGGHIHPYRSLIHHPEQVATIPEVEGQPALRRILEIINGPKGAFESVRVDSSYHEHDGGIAHIIVVGFIFRDRRLFGSFDNCLLFAGKLLEALHADEAFRDSEDSAQLEIQRAVLTEHAKEGWIMDLYLMGQGQDQDSSDRELARRCRALHHLLEHAV
ncbi:MAG: hypothetical protein UMU75_07535 [Halomonas sp.]|nr:hypothetical protein [Halomonas sp.]